MSIVEEILQFVDKVTIALHLDIHKSNVLALYCATNQNKFQEWKDYSSTEQFNSITRYIKTPTTETNATDGTAATSSENHNENLDSQDSNEQMRIYDLTAGYSRETVVDASAAEYPEDTQPCTCDVARQSSENALIQCRRHLSRRFPNKGCYWCNYTDCGKFHC